MEAKELRIDNHVRFGELGTNFQISEISPTGLGVYDDNEETWIELDQFEPIPLSEEWLLKFGFEKYEHDTKDHRYAHYRKDNICFTVYSAALRIEALFAHTKEIRYVHQLQNLYFALTGKELEINETIKN